jgi:hypothetical protein
MNLKCLLGPALNSYDAISVFTIALLYSLYESVLYYRFVLDDKK